MLRNKNLIPLSRQHQHALALCVRIERATPIEEWQLAQWQEEMAGKFEGEIKIHFFAEEQIVFPAARNFAELSPLVDRLLAEHQLLRTFFINAEAKQLRSEEISDFARKLSGHIRAEERELFERVQGLLPAEELDRIGRELDRALESAAQSCRLPSAEP
jgi:hemerythrin superfamily protein